MPIPFPGMDPWLERPGLWPEVHLNLIVSLQNELVRLVRPRYYVAIGQRKVFDVAPSELNFIVRKSPATKRNVPDDDNVKPKQTTLTEPVIVEVPIREKIPEDYLEVVETSTHQVVTVIEILSLSNKTPGVDRKRYEAKRERIFRSGKNLVEIDLRRDGEPMPFRFLQANVHISQYRILVKRGEHWRRAYLYPFNVRDPLPIFPLPLKPGDAEPPVRLGEVLKKIYDQSGYDLRIDYSQPPEPPLSEADAQWAKEVLRAQGAVIS
jgi:Protein of unknown function (DUF4058)